MTRPSSDQVKELRQWALGFDRYDPVTPPSVADTTLALCDDWLAQDEALTRISEQQPKTLAMIEANGFVFDDIGREPGNWQHLAFTIYTDLCEIDSISRTALDAAGADGSGLLGDVTATTNPAGAAKWTDGATPTPQSGGQDG